MEIHCGLEITLQGLIPGRGLILISEELKSFLLTLPSSLLLTSPYFSLPDSELVGSRVTGG